ncbi:MAG TPA: hypothetical protein PLH64_06765 [Anaerolineaceae bacterium]|nr:hypothetical protein [Anaerolineaceae bacterium]
MSQGEIFLQNRDLPASRFAAQILFGGHLMSNKVMRTREMTFGLTAVSLLAKFAQRISGFDKNNKPGC